MSEERVIKAGDSVLHKPSEETWVVAAISPDGKEFAACGWPETIAQLSDCELKRKASPEEQRKTLLSAAEAKNHGGLPNLRTHWARDNLERFLGLCGYREAECMYCGGSGKRSEWRGIPKEAEGER